MTKRKPYSRKRLKQRINGLTEILQDGVSAGDLPEIAVSHVLYTLSNFELRLAEQEALKRLDDLPPEILKLPLKAIFTDEQETTP
nr:MAG TPA: hypothetical protein [Caudoviricetes sp.]